MVLVLASDVGQLAWSRMIRDGVVAPLSRGSGHAADAERSSALRAASLASVVPRRATITGLAALWVHGWEGDAAAPLALEIAVPRGCHPGTPRGADAAHWSFVTDQATCRTAIVVGGVLVADAPHAAASALARAPLAQAIAASVWALSLALIDPTTGHAAIRDCARGAASNRAHSAWNAACAATGAR